MSTEPHNLKIRIRMSGPASAPAAEIPAVPETTSRPVLMAAVSAVIVLLLVWGVWSMFTKHSRETPPSAVTDVPPAAEPPAAATATAPAEEPAKSIPAPAAHKAATPQHTAPVAPAKEQSATPSSSANLVVRAVLTDKMRNHQPANEFSGDVPASDVTKRLYFFTEVHDISSRRYTHRWEYRGKPVAQINFKPSGKNWSTSSSKQIPTHMQGEWRVVLSDDQGHDLTSIDFVYGTPQ